VQRDQPDMGKLNVTMLRYLRREDFRVLTSVGAYILLGASLCHFVLTCEIAAFCTIYLKCLFDDLTVPLLLSQVDLKAHGVLHSLCFCT